MKKHLYSIIRILFLCFLCTGCEKLFESDIEDNLSLTDAEWQEEIRGIWKVIGACKDSNTPTMDGKEYHIPHTYPTKLSYIVTTADSMKFVYNRPVPLIIQVPQNVGEGLIYSWQDGPSFSVTECSFAYKGGGLKSLQGVEADEECWRKYTKDWMDYFHDAEFGGSKKKSRKSPKRR